MGIKDWFGNSNTSFLKPHRVTVEKINSLEEAMKALPDSAFPEKTLEFKTRLAEGATLDSILPEAFALVREASRRTLGQRHYDVQLIGGITLHSGKIAEMRTGEGKTLVATLPTYLNALEGKGVHVVTVNDYLSKRDGSWMGQVYSFLGLTVGVINSQNISYLYDGTKKETEKEKEENLFKVEYEFLKQCSRKESYAADITYGTNNEFGFDYLRDNLTQTKDGIMQRPHHYAVVDEIDSILIDEARTPLIIAGDAGDSEKLYEQFATIAKQLKKGEDFEVDEKLRAISLTQDGITKAEKLLNIDNIYTEKGIKYVHHLETAVRAEAVFLKDKDYVIKDGEVVIVDAFTGRLQPGRRWNEGLHQAIEAKEGVKIQKETRAVASITFQNYFRFYKKLSGMTGTAKTSEEEFQKVYNLDVIQIPTHREINRKDHNDLIFKTEQGKFKAVARHVKTLHTKGQPVLIGTVSIERNELLSAYLTQEGIPHTVLNAKNHEREGEIIAQAGKKGSVVVATNMAGRGIDIILGGAPRDEKAQEEIKALGGLYVLGTERHEARRIDNQLRGRAGRQGDPGETQFFVSLDDDLMRVFGGGGIKSMMQKLGFPDDQPIENRIITRSLENAQAKIEGFNFDSRKHTLEYDDVMNLQRKTIYERRRKMLVAEKQEIEEYFTQMIAGDEEMQKVIEEKITLVGEDAFWDTVRRIILYVTDILWTEHIETMEYTRSSVNLRAYGQREPLVEYKKEGLRLFKEMEMSFTEQVMSLVKTINTDAGKPVQNNSQSEKLVEHHEEAKQFAGMGKQQPEVKAEQGTIVLGDKTGRNDPCPCGSGKKFKHCGLINSEEHQKNMAGKS
jgi:preprotein translocase subunit SecA